MDAHPRHDAGTLEGEVGGEELLTPEVTQRRVRERGVGHREVAAHGVHPAGEGVHRDPALAVVARGDGGEVEGLHRRVSQGEAADGDAAPVDEDVATG